MKQIIYQVLTRLWGSGKMSAWDTPAFNYLKTLNVDCIWYTGIPRHASGEDFVKGNPGSPYSISDWKDVNPYLADDPDNRMQEFLALVERTHRAGLKCIIDFIPNHVARNYSGDIVHYEYCDGDWTDTFKNDYTSPRTTEALLDVLRFWAEKGVDGFRCDMVELVPQDALKYMISSIKQEYPGTVFIAEAYDRNNYRSFTDYVGFDLLYDKSGVYDILRGIICNGDSARKLSWNWQGLRDLQPRMLNFLENHDEQRAASPWFAGSADRTFAAVAYAALFNEASFMLYFGQEAGENASEGHEGRTSIFEWSKPSSISKLTNYINNGKSLNNKEKHYLHKFREILRYAAMPQFRRGNCWDLCYCQEAERGFDADRHSAFLRFMPEEKTAYAVLCNFSDSPASVSIAIPPEINGKGTTVNMEAGADDFSITEIHFE